MIRNLIKIFSFLTITTISISAQSKLYLFGSGGINYSPMESITSFLNQFPDNKKDDISFNGEIALRLNFFTNHNSNLSVGITNKNVLFGDGFGGADWDIMILPISIGYNYSLGSEEENKLLTLFGLNLSYNFIQIDEKSYSDIGGHNPNAFYKLNKLSIDPNVIMIYKLNKDFSLLSKLGYRFIEDVELWHQKLNFSGIIFNVGLQVKIFNAI